VEVKGSRNQEFDQHLYHTKPSHLEIWCCWWCWC